MASRKELCTAGHQEPAARTETKMVGSSQLGLGSYSRGLGGTRREEAASAAAQKVT